MISAVVPVYNEQESLQAFYKVLVPNLSKLNEDFEIIFIDDGSTDSSLKILKQFTKINSKVNL
jgi:dolichol-phosphate mannosyltransferase